MSAATWETHRGRVSLAVFLAGAMFLIFSAVQWAVISIKGRSLPAMASTTHTRPQTAGLERLIGQAAMRNNVRKLLSVGLDESKTRPEVRVEWEAPLTETTRFLADLERNGFVDSYRELKMAGAGDGSSALRGLTVFVVGSMTASTDDKKTAAIVAPDVFVRTGAPRVQTAVVAQPKKEDLAQVAKLAAEREKVQREQEEAAQLEARRRQLETGLVLTGILDNGRELLALIDDSSGGRGTAMLRCGDTVQGARIDSIDEKKGEVRLDVDGRFQVVLRTTQRGSMQ